MIKTQLFDEKMTKTGGKGDKQAQGIWILSLSSLLITQLGVFIYEQSTPAIFRIWLEND